VGRRALRTLPRVASSDVQQTAATQQQQLPAPAATSTSNGGVGAPNGGHSWQQHNGSHPPHHRPLPPARSTLPLQLIANGASAQRGEAVQAAAAYLPHPPSSNGSGSAAYGGSTNGNGLRPLPPVHQPAREQQGPVLPPQQQQGNGHSSWHGTQQQQQQQCDPAYQQEYNQQLQLQQQQQQSQQQVQQPTLWQPSPPPLPHAHQAQPPQQPVQQQQQLAAVPVAAASAAAADAEPPINWNGIVLGPGGSQWALPEGAVTEVPPDVLMVDTPEAAEAVVAQLLRLSREGVTWQDAARRTHHEAEVYFACDTEVAGIDIKTQSPVGHGTVICFSIYAGPWVDFSLPDSASAAARSGGGTVAAAAAAPAAAAGQQQQQQHVRKSRVWVDLTANWAQEVQQRLAAEAQQAALEQEQQRLELELLEQQAAAQVPEEATPDAAASSHAHARPAAAAARGKSRAAAAGPSAESGASTEQLLQEARRLLDAGATRPALYDAARQLQLAINSKTKIADLRAALEDHLRSQPGAAAAAAEAPAAPAAAPAAAVPAADGVLDSSVHSSSSSSASGSSSSSASGSSRRQQSSGSHEAAAAEQEAAAVAVSELSTKRRRSRRTRAPSTQQVEAAAAAESSRSSSSGNGVVAAAAVTSDGTSLQLQAGGELLCSDPLYTAGLTSSNSPPQLSGQGRASAAVAVAAAEAGPAAAASDTVATAGSRVRSSRRSSTGSAPAADLAQGSLAICGLLGGGVPPPSVAELRADPLASSILQAFVPFFTDAGARKVWHNYGFDRHVLQGLLGRSTRLAGFGGDTLHMSRLWDASRKTRGGYGLEALSGDREVRVGGCWVHPGPREACRESKAGFGTVSAPALPQPSCPLPALCLPCCMPPFSTHPQLKVALQADLGGEWVEADASNTTKRGMKERFGCQKVKADGLGLVKAAVVPPMHLLQIDGAFRPGWIDYSALDAKVGCCAAARVLVCAVLWCAGSNPLSPSTRITHAQSPPSYTHTLHTGHLERPPCAQVPAEPEGSHHGFLPRGPAGRRPERCHSQPQAAKRTQAGHPCCRSGSSARSQRSRCSRRQRSQGARPAAAPAAAAAAGVWAQATAQAGRQ
jgi:hypothetical protein